MREYFRLLGFLKPYKGYLLLSFVLILFFSVSNAISIYLSIPLLRTLFTSESTLTRLYEQEEKSIETTPIGSFFDNLKNELEKYIMSEGDKFSALTKVCLLMLLFYFLKNLFLYLQSILTQYVEKSLVTDLRKKLYFKFNSLPLKYFSEKKSGDIISRIINDVNLIQNTVSVTFTNLLKDPMLIIIFLALAFSISWKQIGRAHV